MAHDRPSFIDLSSGSANAAVNRQIGRKSRGRALAGPIETPCRSFRAALINSSSPRRRGSSTLFLMDSRLRGNEKIDFISSSLNGARRFVYAEL